MPKTRVGRLAQRLAETKRWKLPVPAGSPPSMYLAEHVVIAFQVSSVAALARLKQLGVGRVGHGARERLRGDPSVSEAGYRGRSHQRESI
jgi:hypothetical protein